MIAEMMIVTMMTTTFAIVMNVLMYAHTILFNFMENSFPTTTAK